MLYESSELCSEGGWLGSPGGTLRKINLMNNHTMYDNGPLLNGSFIRQLE